MAKFHINSNGEAKPCTATKKACRFGEEDHFATKESALKGAAKKIEVEFKAREKARKKRRLPNTLKIEDYDDMTPEQKADYMVFEGMKENEDFALGATSERYYGSGAGGVLTPEEVEELADHGVDVSGTQRMRDRMMQSLHGRIELVPGTLRETSTDHYNGTFADGENVIHLEADAVLTLPDGHRMPMAVTCISSFDEVLQNALAKNEPPEMKVMRDRAKDSRARW